MIRDRKDPFSALTDKERGVLKQISGLANNPARHVTGAKALLGVVNDRTHLEAAEAVEPRAGDEVGLLVSRSSWNGLATIAPRHGGGAQLNLCFHLFGCCLAIVVYTCHLASRIPP